MRWHAIPCQVRHSHTHSQTISSLILFIFIHIFIIHANIITGACAFSNRFILEISRIWCANWILLRNLQGIVGVLALELDVLSACHNECPKKIEP